MASLVASSSVGPHHEVARPCTPHPPPPKRTKRTKKCPPPPPPQPPPLPKRTPKKETGTGPPYSRVLAITSARLPPYLSRSCSMWTTSTGYLGLQGDVMFEYLNYYSFLNLYVVYITQLLFILGPLYTTYCNNSAGQQRKSFFVTCLPLFVRKLRRCETGCLFNS